jgi:hypothetical protein
MKTILNLTAFTLLFLVGSITLLQAQDDRVLLRGQVLFRSVNVPNENVINITTENATATDENGRFAILVKAGDELAFSAVNYQLQVVKITDDLLQKNRLVIEVQEKVTELSEVVVTPEDQARFLEMQNEQFKKYEYETDRSSEVDNIALSRTERGMTDGLNFVNIFKALLKASTKDDADITPLKVSEVLRQVYDDEFFVVDLKLKQDQIDGFLAFLDARAPERSLLKKDNEFQLIDYLVTNSKAYLKSLDGEK